MDKTFFERWIEDNQAFLDKKFYELKVSSLVDTRRLLNLLEMAYNAGRELSIETAIKTAKAIKQTKEQG